MKERTTLISPEEAIDLFQTALGVDTDTAIATDDGDGDDDKGTDTNTTENDQTDQTEAKEGDKNVKDKDTKTDETAVADLEKDRDTLKTENDELKTKLLRIERAGVRTDALKEIGVTFASDDTGKALASYILDLEDTDFDNLVTIAGLAVQSAKATEDNADDKTDDDDKDNETEGADDKTDDKDNETEGADDKTDDKDDNKTSASMVAGDAANASSGHKFDAIKGYLKKSRDTQLIPKTD